MKRMAFVLFAALASAGACSITGVEQNAGDPVAVTLDQSVYSPGDTVRGAVRNLTGRTVQYTAGFCYTRLQRRANDVTDRWDDVLPPGGLNVACALVASELAPHGSAQLVRIIPGSAVDGLYRLLIPVPSAAEGAGPGAVPSPTFVVGAVALGSGT
jgi:hypothetical protein